MKKIICLVTALLLCLSLTACSDKNTPEESTDSITEQTTKETEKEKQTEEKNTTEDKESKVTPLLYKITDTDGDVIWLFGSIHVGREDFYPLPDYVTDAFDSSEGLAVELNIVEFEKNMKEQINALAPLVFADGTTISDHITEESYENAVEILDENGVYLTLYDRYRPVMWSNLIDNIIISRSDAEVDLGIDRHLIEMAGNADKEILDIESAKAQYSMLASFSPELQQLMLDSSIEAYYSDTAEQELEELVDLWAMGDAEGLCEYLDESDEFDEGMEELYTEYETAMVLERNLLMTEFAANALEEGEELFICVGAAHVVGDDGIAALLEKQGCTVEIIK
ncbi:MAG: TraB/GumN family protein [Clostridia bacterium]|nr:TraB/GumN family protein [Clostridia bacterium]